MIDHVLDQVEAKVSNHITVLLGDHVNGVGTEIDGIGHFEILQKLFSWQEDRESESVLIDIDKIQNNKL